jgi:septal ring factor EnvC (AmiA/AmiB activator)
MTMLDVSLVDDAIAKLKAIAPRVTDLETVNAELARARAQLAKARDEFTSVAADRDRARDDFANCRAELLVIQAALNAAYRERDEVERQLKQRRV